MNVKSEEEKRKRSEGESRKKEAKGTEMKEGD